ncbi:hypothetical protein WJ66_01676 [Stenotrophomonas maltophilia WJ66]|nr:hypothetical protein WJ66_01676 [Stenotrophomonas maltophilia WJ66]
MKAALEPDGQLGRHLETLQGFGVTTVQLVVGLVAGFANPVKQIRHFAR